MVNAATPFWEFLLFVIRQCDQTKRMSDDFYGPFDQECFCDEFNRGRKSDYRTVFHQDRDRIMFSPAFRRLQAKTQVFQAGEYDFYRTRLTHSLEVSRIAESIAIWLRGANPEVRVDTQLLEAISLAHDIGHPPFGHAGERVLNELMNEFGGFEGNAQTLRILTRTIYSRTKGRNGMSPSRALLDGVLKYKRLYRDKGDETNHFIYDDQEEILTFCFGEGDLAKKLDSPDVNRFQSLECQIMDLADDIAYSCFDIVDGVKARFLSREKLEAWRESKGGELEPLQGKYLDELIDMIKKNKLQPLMNGVIGDLIQSASVKPGENFMTSRTHRHSYQLQRNDTARARIKLQKTLCRELVFGSSALQQIEYKGGQILRGLAQTLFDNYLGKEQQTVSGVKRETPRQLVLISSEVHGIVCEIPNLKDRARLLCDHLSGMTDAYALRSYKRLFDPDYGSISELI
jgi:dGTPase